MKRSASASVSFAILLIFLFCAAGIEAAQENQSQKEPPIYRSADFCRRCHSEIYKTWKGSRHATSFTDPAFRIPYERIRSANPGKKFPCENCHNPGKFLFPPGSKMAATFALEGVTCDFCHSVESVMPDGPFPKYKTEPGIKRSPRGGQPGKTFHETMFSGLHITSDFCAGCHEFRNEYGIPVLATYSEWKESFYRGQSVHCQFCHLPQLFDAGVVSSKRKGGPLDHSMSEGNIRERLGKAIPVRADLKISGSEANLTVTLKNENVGHKTPSGIPNSRLHLVTILRDRDGKELGRKDEFFGKILGDGKGKPLNEPELIFTSSREILSDNRLAPKETRKIRHVFALKGEVPAMAEASLLYEENFPDTLPKTGVVITRIVVPARMGISVTAVAIAAAIVFMALIGLVFFLRKRSGEKGKDTA